MRTGLISALIAALALSACAAPAFQTQSMPATQASAEQRVVYIVRHMQKGTGDDPALTAAGEANARQLAAILEGKGITAIFATPTRRAMETAEPLATRLGLAVTPYDPRNPDALAAAAASSPGPVLVVGHSNTVADLVGRFGGTPPPPLTEQDYGTVFVVEADGQVATLEVR